MSQEVLNINHVQHIYAIDIRPDPARLIITQDGTRIGIKIGQVDGTVLAKITYGLCGSFRADAKVDDFRIEGDYDVFDGMIKNVSIDYNVTQLDVNAYNAFGWVCKTAYDA